MSGPRHTVALGAGGATLEIAATRRAGVAPAGIAFVATARGWDVAHPAEDLRFEWRFGDPEARFEGLDRVGAVWGEGADRAFGDRAAHVFHPPRAAFAAAGGAGGGGGSGGGGGGAPARFLSYRVRCTATDGARAVTAEIEVTVENPDAVFAGDRTVLVSPDGDFSGAPAPTVGGPYDRALEIPSRTDGRRILLAPGRRHAVRDRITVDRAGQPTQIGPWGPGPRPILACRSEARRDTMLRCKKMSPAGEIALWGLACESTWDATTERAADGVFPWRGLSLGGGVQGHVTLRDCRLSGFSNTIANRSGTVHLILSGTEVTNWRDYGLHLGSQKVLALVGCRVEQHVDAMGGGAVPLAIRGGSNLQNDHGPIRVARVPEGSWTLLSQTQLRSLNGWSAGNAGRGVPNGPSHQPCLRWNTATRPGGVLRFDRVVTEGGNPAVNNGRGRKRTSEDKRCDILLDKLITIGTSNNGGTVWRTVFSGAVCRNFLAIVPPTASGRWELLPPDSLMVYGGGRRSAYSPHALDGRLHVYSGTVLDWTEVDKVLLGNSMPEGAALRSVVVSNVLHHAPNYAADPRDLGPTLRLAALFAPSYRGMKWQNKHKGRATYIRLRDGTDTGRENKMRDRRDSPTVDAAHASVARLPDGTPTVALPFPDPGRLPAALGAGDRVALDDLLGRLRGPMPHAGALEPR